MVCRAVHPMGTEYDQVKVKCGAAVTKGYFVEKDTTNGGVKNLAADGNAAWGIATKTGVAGDYIMVARGGIWNTDAETGDDFYTAETVYSTDDGKLIDDGGSFNACGACVIEDISSGGNGNFLFVPSQT